MNWKYIYFGPEAAVCQVIILLFHSEEIHCVFIGSVQIQGFGIKEQSAKWGLAARQSKANKECRLVERKVCFILDSGNRWWGGRTPVQRPTPPSADNQGARAFIDRRRGPHAETIVSSDRHLEIGHRWSDQHHLDCFRYS